MASLLSLPVTWLSAICVGPRACLQGAVAAMERRLDQLLLPPTAEDPSLSWLDELELGDEELGDEVSGPSSHPKVAGQDSQLWV